MKYISQQSDRLAVARKLIENLEHENVKLKRDNAVLRFQNGRSAKSSRCVSPSKQETPREHGYARPTVASLSRKKSKLSQEPPVISPQKVVTQDGEYIYQAGTPIQTVGAPWSIPHYMKGTVASYERNRKDCIPLAWENRRGLGGARGQSEDEISEQSTDPDYSSASLSSKDPENEEEVHEPDTSESELAVRSRLNDPLRYKADLDMALIASKSGLDYLRAAVDIIQKSVYEIGNKRTPGWPRFHDGPHLIKLGRNELNSWLWAVTSDYNGLSAATIARKLLDVVPLRNAISHPHPRVLQDPHTVDNLLSYAQDLTVALGDEAGSMQLREIRDALFDEAFASLQDIADMHYLYLQPYREVVEHKAHHISMFKHVLQSRSCKSRRERALRAVAEVWASDVGYTDILH